MADPEGVPPGTPLAATDLPTVDLADAGLREPATDSKAATSERPATYRDVFSVRPYRHLFAASLLSQSGDQLTKVAMASLVLARTGSAVLTAITYAITYLPWIIGGPVLSAYADRLPRRQVLVTCDVARVALVLALALPKVPLSVLLLILFASNLLGSPFNAAQAALMPELLDGDRYMVANGLDGIVRQVAQVGGFAVGGVVVWALHPTGALIADAATFALSALLILRGVPSLPRSEPETLNQRSVLRDTAEGARVVFGDPTLRAYVLLFWVASSFAYAYEAIAVPYAAEFGGGARTAGLLLAAGPLGQSTGTFVLSRLLAPSTRIRLVPPFAVLSTAALVPILAAPPLPVVLGLLFLTGFGASFAAPLNALFGRAVTDQYRGRAFGLAGAGISLCYGLTMLAAGGLADLPSLRESTVIGASGVVGTLAVLALTRIWPTYGPPKAL